MANISPRGERRKAAEELFAVAPAAIPTDTRIAIAGTTGPRGRDEGRRLHDVRERRRSQPERRRGDADMPSPGAPAASIRPS